jgi:hypothetical protein
MLPLKLRIFEYAYQVNKPFTAEDVIRDLAPEYGAESQFTKKRILEYLHSFLGVGMLEAQNVEFDDKGELVIHCMITDFGLSRVKYIPKH